MLDRAGNVDRDRALAICATLPSRPTQVAAWIWEGGLTATPRTKSLLFLEPEGGLAFVSDLGVIMPHLTRAESLDELARRVGPIASRVVVGPRWAAEAYWDRLVRRGSRARLRREQVGYAVARSAFRILERPSLSLALRPAGPDDLDALVEASAAMAVEESNDDPGRRNPALFRARIAERVARGRDFVLFEGRELVFKVNVAAISPHGGHIEGVYTTPAFRGQGVGRAGVAWVTRWILERGELATLLVNESNQAARRIYEDLGFDPAYPSCTILAR